MFCTLCYPKLIAEFEEIGLKYEKYIAALIFNSVQNALFNPAFHI